MGAERVMISIIVPVYRVEKYLDKCIQSLRTQTYQNLEIILVDDGSDDTCPRLCDEYTKIDSRIKVIHKKNGGLSDARNAGLQVASGEYVMFVDSDDYIHSKLCEYMVTVLEHMEEVDLALCPFQKVKEEDNTMEERTAINDEFRILNHEQVIHEMFSDDYLTYTVPWNKMYRKAMWDGMEFPVGKIHEDEFTSHILLYQARKVAYFRQPSYYYRQRSGSIMESINPKECADKREAWEKKISFFSEKEPESYALCVSKTLTGMIWNYEGLLNRGEIGEADKVRQLFQNEWRKAKENKISGITKERRACFNSFSISYKWMKFYMSLYWKYLSVGKKVKGKYYYQKGKFQAGRRINPQIASVEETLERIIESRASVSRYGDGEFKWMVGIPQESFQVPSEEMSRRFREIIVLEEPDLLICLSDGFGRLDYLKPDAQSFWYRFMGQYRKKWIDLLKPGKKYYNTNMTRPYMDYKDKSPCENRFQLLKKIWEDRDVILIEGEKSRLGVGNDLFDGAKKLNRILAPAQNAYNKYEEILQTALKCDEDALYLIALGPTATILAYDLYKAGRQAIDVGHVDIEYEWFLRGANEKIKIPNKYVNEVNGGNGVSEVLEDEKYQEQILGRIEQW